MSIACTCAAIIIASSNQGSERILYIFCIFDGITVIRDSFRSNKYNILLVIAFRNSWRSSKISRNGSPVKNSAIRNIFQVTTVDWNRRLEEKSTFRATRILVDLRSKKQLFLLSILPSTKTFGRTRSNVIAPLKSIIVPELLKYRL